MTVEKEDFHKAMWWLEHQRLFFFGAFALGTLLILTLKALGVHGGFVSALTVGIMISYAILGVRNKIKVRLDTIGDNLYYLGFLFTLVSLSYSLYQLGRGISDINNLLENFGIAIMTTLTGLALRVFFNQPQADIAEYEDTIRLSLTEATANFIGETSKIGRDISTLRSVLDQYIRETRAAQQTATQSLSNAIDEQIGLLNKTSTKNQENIDALLEKIKSAQDNFANNFKINSELMGKTINESMAHIRLGANNFVNKFSEINESFENLRKTMNFLNGILQTWDATTEKIINTNANIAKHQELSQDQLRISQEQVLAISKELSEKFHYISDSLTTLTSESIEKIQVGSTSIEDKFKGISDAALELASQIQVATNQIKLSFVTLNNIDNSKLTEVVANV